MVVTFLTTMGYGIAVARAIGPEKLGYFQVVWFWALAGCNLATLGIPGTTRRYIAEALGRNNLPVARGIFLSTWKLQFLLAAAILVIGEVVVFAFTRRSYWSSSWLLILCLAPRFLAMIPAMVQVAAERLGQNLIATTAASATMIAVLWYGLWSGWGVVAAAAAFLALNVVDMVLKSTFAVTWLKLRPRVPIEAGLQRRMLSFSTKSTLLMLLSFVVWDKSDMFFLQILVKDPKVWSFFTTAYGFADKIIWIVAVFGNSIGVALYGEIGRSMEKLNRTAAVGLRYCLLLASVLLFGLAAVAPWLVVTLYGKAYAAAGPLLVVAALLAAGKCVMPVVGTVFAAAERQGAVVIVVLGCGLLDVVLDLLLIPRWGALGATVANGVAQTLAAAIMIWYAGRSCGVQWKLRELLPGAAAGLGTGLAAWLAGMWLPSPAARLAVGVAAGAIACPILFRLLRVFGPEDSYRINELVGSTPPWLRQPLDPLFGFLIPRERG
jgi:O-antigen/teichoic acid export membrane protein